MKQWLDKQQALVPPKSLFGKAITYGLNQWPYLICYLESGLLDIDNNAAGRKNWLCVSRRRSYVVSCKTA